MLQIDEVYCFIADGRCSEHLVGETINGFWKPFVCLDESEVNSLRAKVKLIGKEHGAKIKLIRYSKREVMEVIT